MRLLIQVLGMLCYGHAGLLTAGQARLLSPDAERFSRIMTQGRVLRKAGQYSNAVVSFHSAAEIARFTGNPDQQAQAMLAQSGCEIRLFRYADALNTIDKAHPIALRAGNNAVLGGLDHNRSLIYSQLGNFQAAEQATNQAIEFLRKSSQKDYFARALINKGEIQFGLNYLNDGKHPQIVPEGVAAFAQAVEVARQNNLPDDEATASDSLGIWLVIVHDLPQAESALRRAYEIRKKLGDRDSLAISEEHLAELELQKGRLFLLSALEHINLTSVRCKH